MEDFGRIKMHEEQIKHAIITIEKGGSPLKELIEPFSPSLFPEQSPSPVLIGADFGQGKDLHSLMLMDMATHKVTHISKDVIVSINEGMTLKVRDNAFAQSPNVEINMEFHLTHKGARKLRKSKRELGLKKTRLPRKMKKKLKTDLKLMRYARGK